MFLREEKAFNVVSGRRILTLVSLHGMDQCVCMVVLQSIRGINTGAKTDAEFV